MSRISFTAVACALVLPSSPAPAGEVAASHEVVTQLEAMNDADCATSKKADWDGFAKTLAPDYVDLEADGSRASRAEMLAHIKAMPPSQQVTACSTRVDRVMRDGDVYRLYGEYTESGVGGSKRQHYLQVERIRDSWKRVDGRWLQTESLAYEVTFTVDGKVVAHNVLPAKP